MLFDAVDFEFVRNDPGVGAEMDKLEAQYGPLDKKMMIQEGDIPAELQDDIDPKRKVLVFESSFDDVNAGFGIAFIAILLSRQPVPGFVLMMKTTSHNFRLRITWN